MDESWRHCFATWALLLCKPIVANEIDRKKPKLSDQKVSGIGRDARAPGKAPKRGCARNTSATAFLLEEATRVEINWSARTGGSVRNRGGAPGAL